jgi:hypothetical protein
MSRLIRLNILIYTCLSIYSVLFLVIINFFNLLTYIVLNLFEYIHTHMSFSIYIQKAWMYNFFKKNIWHTTNYIYIKKKELSIGFLDKALFKTKEGNLKEMNLITNHYLPLKIRITLDSSSPTPLALPILLLNK